jgi:hypothetical protein
MANTLTQIGIETGNIVEAYHVSQSIDAFTGAEAYDITLSGSLTVTGSVAINGLSSTSQNNILTINTTTGQLYYTSSNSIGGGGNTGSFLITASATNNIITFTKGDGSTFPVTVNTGSGGGGGITPSETGSFYYSSSVNLNTITFHQGDGTTESVTVNTGSLSIPSSISQFGGVNIVEVTTATYQIPNSGSYRIFQNRTGGSLCTITMPTTASVGDVIEIYEVPGSVRTKISQNGSGATGQTIGAFSHTTSVGTAGSIVTRTGSAVGLNDDLAYLKLLCYNAGSGTSVGQRWQVVEFSSEYWLQPVTYGPFDILDLIEVI